MDLEDVKGWFGRLFETDNNNNNDTIPKNKQQSQTSIVMTNGNNINYNTNNKQWYKNDKRINPNTYYFYDNTDKCYKQLNTDGSTYIAPRYVATGKPIVPKKIGGNHKQSQIDYFTQYPEQDVILRQVAKNTDISHNLLKSRYISEGPVDNNIIINNKNINNKIPIYGHNALDYWDNPKQVLDTKKQFGTDDTGTWYKEGKLKLPKGVCFTIRNGTNVHGRPVKYLQGRTNRDNLYIMAASLKYLRGIAQKEHPTANDNELDAWASAMYHYGVAGARKIKTRKYLIDHYTEKSPNSYITISSDFDSKTNKL